MSKSQKYLWFFIAAVGITVVYFILRLFHLMTLPLFTDEAIYVRWAQIAKQDANWRFISLVDGKQPLWIWAAAVLMKIFHDPLFAGRMVSVLAGFASTVGLFFLGAEVFKKSKNGKYPIFGFDTTNIIIGLVSASLYVVYPFSLVYDKMALYEPLVGTFTIWTLYILIIMVRSLRLDVAMIAGFLAGCGALTKTSDFFSVYSIPFLLLIFDWNKKNRNSRLIRFVSLSIVVAVIMYGMYSVLRLSPFFHIIAEKNAVFIYPVGEWIHHPFTYLWGNLSGLLNWFYIYFTLPFIILAAAAFILKKDFFLEKAVLFLYFAFPFAGAALFGRLLYPRYVHFMSLPLLVLVAYSLVVLWQTYKNTLIRILIIVCALSFAVYADVFILFNFPHAPIPQEDLGQLVNDWTAGNGVKQSVSFFSQQAQNGKIFIGTEGTFGLMPYGLEMYLVQNPNIKIVGYWPINSTIPADALAASKKMPSYFVFYQPCSNCSAAGEAPTSWPLKKIASYRQGIGSAHYSIYQIIQK